MRKISLILLTAVAVLTWGYPASVTVADPASAPAESPTVEEIAAQYLTYQKMTARRVLVNVDFIADCVGSISEEKEREIHGPHSGTSILIYMNDPAAKAFEADKAAATSYPVGAVVVKQKLIHRPPARDRKKIPPGTTGVGGMVKRAPGFDPQGGDWEYFYFVDPKNIEAGRIKTCAQCHQAASEKDFVFGTWTDPSKY